MTTDIDLERVREAYPDAEEPSAERLASLRARLTGLIDASASQQEAARPRRRVTRRRWRSVAAVCAAALVAGLVVLSGILQGGAERPVTAAAATLERYARTISQQAWHPLRPGEWFYYREIGSSGHNRPATARPALIQDVWIGANGFARIVQTGPNTVIPGGDVVIFHATRQQLQAERERQRRGAHLRILAYGQKYHWVDLDYQQLIHLPTDPSKLQRYIEQHATGGGPRFSDIFSYAEGYLRGAPLPPKVSAAMYRVIAHLPGMRLIGPTRDPLGRPGVAVGLFFKDQPGRIELIFDPKTGVLLGERGISLDATREHAPVGSVTDWVAIERQGVVKSDHELPASTTAVRGQTSQ
jgi:hypothetical protein